MQIYLNLDTQQEKQLFSDVNTERREAHVGLIMQYDKRDYYTEVTRKLSEELDELFEIEKKLSRVTNFNSAVTSLAIMKKCLIAMFEGILTVKVGPPSVRM